MLLWRGCVGIAPADAPKRFESQIGMVPYIPPVEVRRRTCGRTR